MALDVGLLNVLVSLGLEDGAGSGLADEIGKAVGPVADQVGQDFSKRLSDGLGKAGKGLTLGVTAPIVAVGGAAIAVGLEVDNALDGIRVGTGATGETLQQLNKDFEEVAKNSTGSFERTGEVIADLNTRLGLTGQPLQDLAKQLIDLEQISGEQTNLDTVTRILAAFNIPAEEATETFDKLFRASQATGVPFNELTNSLVSQSAAFSELGFGLDETAALLGQFEKAGVNTETVLGGLRQNIVAAAKEGESAADFFRAGVSEIEGYLAAGDEAAAQARARELFGARTFLDALDAIKRGQFDITGTLDALQNGNDTISSLASETADFPEQLDKLKKSAALALLPIADVLIPAITDAITAVLPIIESVVDAFRNLSPETQKTIVVFAGVAAAIGPLLLIAAKVVSAVSAIVGILKILNLTLLLNPWVLIGVAAVAVVVLIVKNWGTISEFFKNLFDKIVEFAKVFVSFTGLGLIIKLVQTIRDNWDGIVEFFKGLFDRIVGFVKTFIGFTGIGLIIKVVQTIRENWDEIVSFFSDLFNRIVSLVKKLVGFTGIGLIIKIVQTIRQNWGAIVTFFTNIFNKITGTVRTVTSGITNTFRTAFNTVRSIIQNVYNFIVGIFRKITSGVSGIIKSITDIPKKIGGAVGGFVGGLIPGFADGGTAAAGQPAIVGERGPELIVPKRTSTVIPNSALSGLGGVNYNITINNPSAEPSSTSIPAALRRASYLRSDA